MRRPAVWRVARVVLIVAAVGFVLFAFYREGQESNSTEDHPSEATITASPHAIRDLATVTRVIDGDTIEAELDGTIIDIRLIGVDTPETVHPSEPVECFGAAASRFTTTMLDGQEIRLEFDVERTDQYGRTLAYVWLGDELFNEVLVRQGFAQVSTYPPNMKYVDEFLAAQRDARSAGRGLWGSRCALEGHGNGGGGGTGGGEGGNCDPSYPDVCIPPYPPDLDCGDIDETNFRVTTDPHGFDDPGSDDPDKIGCET